MEISHLNVRIVSKSSMTIIVKSSPLNSCISLYQISRRSSCVHEFMCSFTFHRQSFLAVLQAVLNLLKQLVDSHDHRPHLLLVTSPMHQILGVVAVIL